jgi:glycine cleavage system H protein
MSDDLILTIDKFSFRFPLDRMYSPEGLWAASLPDGNLRVGLTDFQQSRSGDLAFAEIRPAGTHLQAGDELAVIETIKVSLSMPVPFAAVVEAVNPALEATPEIVNADPFGEGWLAALRPIGDSRAALEGLMDAQASYEAAWRTLELEGRR